VTTTQRARRVIYNSGMLTLAKGLEALLSVVLVAFVARYLGTEGFGTYGFVVSLAQVFVVAGQMGLPRILVREVSRDREQTAQYLGNAVSLILLAMSVGLLAAIVLTSLIGPDVETVLAMMTYFLSEAILAVPLLGYSVFRAHERMEYQAIISVLGQTFKVVLALLFIRLDLGLVALFVAMCIANACKLLLVQYVLHKKHLISRPRWSFPLIEHLFLSALPVGASFLLRSWAWQGGIVVLTMIRGEPEAGLVYGPLRVVDQFKILPYALASSLLPVLSHQSISDRTAFLATIEGALKGALICGLVIALTVSALADPIVLLVFGPQFSQSAVALRILGWATLFTFPNILIGAALVALDKPGAETVCLGITLVATLLVSVLLVPEHGFRAVCYAILLGEALFFTLSFLYIWHRTSLVGAPKAVLKILAVGALAGGFIQVGHSYNVYAALVLGLLLLLSSLLWAHVFSEPEMQFLKRLLSTSSRQLERCRFAKRG
jgi:O-antigen/teichoic acid export membrane protein